MPDEAYRIPFGEANVSREGKDVTMVAFGPMVPRALAVAEAVAKDGISVEVIDPRTTSPLDEDTILESVAKTGRLVLVDESPPRCSLADVAAIVADKGFKSLKAPIGSDLSAYARAVRAQSGRRIHAQSAPHRSRRAGGNEVTSAVPTDLRRSRCPNGASRCRKGP